MGNAAFFEGFLLRLRSRAGSLRSRIGLPARSGFDDPGRRRPDDGSRLAGLASRWRTSAQLSRLEGDPKAGDATFRFAVLGDVEPGRFWIFRKLFNMPGVFERQVRSIQREGVDFSVQLGDMVSRGTARNYLRFFEELSRWEISTPYLTVIGNHDRRYPHGLSDSSLYRDLFGKSNYSFDRGPARFVALDSSAHRVTRRQLGWLDRVLDTRLRKIVFTHIPPAALRSWTDMGPARGVKGFRPGAEELVGILSRRKVDRVYMGHIHGFGVQDFGGVRYILTGGGGSPLFPLGVADRFYHYLTVSIGPNGVQDTVHCSDGGTMVIPRGAVLL